MLKNDKEVRRFLEVWLSDTEYLRTRDVKVQGDLASRFRAYCEEVWSRPTGVRQPELAATEVAEKSGVSRGTVDRVRRGLRLQDDGLFVAIVNRLRRFQGELNSPGSD